MTGLPPGPDHEQAARAQDLIEDITDIVRAGDDLGDVLSFALGCVAARVGGVSRLVESRPGSWEAGHVRKLAEQYAPRPVA